MSDLLSCVVALSLIVLPVVAAWFDVIRVVALSLSVMPVVTVCFGLFLKMASIWCRKIQH